MCVYYKCKHIHIYIYPINIFIKIYCLWPYIPLIYCNFFPCQYVNFYFTIFNGTMLLHCIEYHDFLIIFKLHILLIQANTQKNCHSLFNLCHLQHSFSLKHLVSPVTSIWISLYSLQYTCTHIISFDPHYHPLRLVSYYYFPHFIDEP